MTHVLQTRGQKPKRLEWLHQGRPSNRAGTHNWVFIVDLWCRPTHSLPIRCPLCPLVHQSVHTVTLRALVRTRFQCARCPARRPARHGGYIGGRDRPLLPWSSQSRWTGFRHTSTLRRLFIHRPTCSFSPTLTCPAPPLPTGHQPQFSACPRSRGPLASAARCAPASVPSAVPACATAQAQAPAPRPVLVSCVGEMGQGASEGEREPHGPSCCRAGCSVPHAQA